MTRFGLAALLTLACTPCNSQVSGGKASQNIGKNDGVAVQVNVTVVQKKLKTIASRNKLTANWEQILEPAKDANPVTRCDQQDAEIRKNYSEEAFRNGLSFYLAGGRTFCPEKECVLLATQGQKLVWLVRQAGVAMIYSKLWASDGSIAAELDGNHVYLNNTAVAFVKRPDTHTIIIVDQKGNELLNLRFLNENSVHLTGVFYPPSGETIDSFSSKLVIMKFGIPAGSEGKPLVISDKKAVFPGGGGFGDMCLVLSGTADAPIISF